MKKLRTVIAEDHLHSRMSLMLFLEALPKVTVVGVAEDGEVALNLVKEFDPDLLILDLNLPKLNGLQVLRHLQQQVARVKVIILSGYAPVISVAYLKKQGLDQQIIDVTDIVDKANPSLLLNAIHKLANMPEQ